MADFTESSDTVMSSCIVDNFDDKLFVTSPHLCTFRFLHLKTQLCEILSSERYTPRNNNVTAQFLLLSFLQLHHMSVYVFKITLYSSPLFPFWLFSVPWVFGLEHIGGAEVILKLLNSLIFQPRFLASLPKLVSHDTHRLGIFLTVLFFGLQIMTKRVNCLK